MAAQKVLAAIAAQSWYRFWIADKIPEQSNPSTRGAIAQLGERVVRNDEAVGSIPTSSTK